jgi:spermidine synthase
VLWTRALVFFLDNSTHAFTTMLTAFLVGIAAGSAIIARFVDARRNLLAWLGAVEVLIGITALSALPILGRSTPVLQQMVAMPTDALLPWKWVALRFLTSLTVMLVPAALMGMTLPLVAKLHTRTLAEAGSSLGRVYSSNTVGGVIGSVLAGFLLIPLFGVQPSIGLVAVASALLGVVLVMAEPALAGRWGAKGVALAGLGIVTAGAVSLSGDADAIASYRERADGATVLSLNEGIGSTVKVFEDRRGDRFLSIDGFPVAGTSLGMQDAQKSLGNLPLLLTNARGARVNLVGFGAGGASWAALQYDVSQVDCAELVPAVLEAATWFPDVNHGVLDEPRFNAIRADGRNYALVTDRVYDVISIDATSPKMAGNGSLYTEEFYRLLRARLSQDGMVVQWLPFHLLSDAEMKMTARTFLRVFPHTTVWLSPVRHHALLVGTPERLRLDVAALGRKLERPGVQDQLHSMGVFEPLDVLAWFVMGEEGLARYVEGAVLNTDNHPYLEFTPAMSYFYAMNYAARNLYDLGHAREDVFPLLFNTGETEAERTALSERVAARLMASQHTLSGDIFFYMGNRDRALGEYRMALVVDPDEKNWIHPFWDTSDSPLEGRPWW